MSYKISKTKSKSPQALSQRVPSNVISCEEILSLKSNGATVSFLDCSREKAIVEFSSGSGAKFSVCRYQERELFIESYLSLSAGTKATA